VSLIRPRNQLVQEGTLLAKNGAKCAKYFSSGMVCGVLVVVTD
jgi:hypothetical protein